MVKKKEMRGSRGVSRKLRVPHFQTSQGMACNRLAFRCTEAEFLAHCSHALLFHLLFWIWLLSSHTESKALNSDKDSGFSLKFFHFLGLHKYFLDIIWEFGKLANNNVLSECFITLQRSQKQNVKINQTLNCCPICFYFLKRFMDSWGMLSLQHTLGCVLGNFPQISKCWCCFGAVYFPFFVEWSKPNQGHVTCQKTLSCIDMMFNGELRAGLTGEGRCVQLDMSRSLQYSTISICTLFVNSTGGGNCFHRLCHFDRLASLPWEKCFVPDAFPDITLTIYLLGTGRHKRYTGLCSLVFALKLTITAELFIRS